MTTVLIILLGLNLIQLMIFFFLRADKRREREIAVKYSLKYSEARQINIDLMNGVGVVAAGLDRVTYSRSEASEMLVARVGEAQFRMGALLTLGTTKKKPELKCKYCGKDLNRNNYWNAAEGDFCNSEHYITWMKDRSRL